MSGSSVTVLLPVYNAGKFLRPTINGILNQSFRDFELLILDDGSTDTSWEIVSSYQDARIRAVRNDRNRGLAATLNRGLEMASGELVARHDSDDLSHRDRLAKQVEIFKRRKDLVAVFSRARLIDVEDRLVGWVRTPISTAAIRWSLCFRNNFVHGSVMFRRGAIWKELGGYRLLPACEDYDLWSRIIRNRGEIAVLKEALVDYRIHKRSVMGREHQEAFAKSQKSLREIMQKNCQTLVPTALSERQIDTLISAWLDPKTANWAAYFATQKNMFRRLSCQKSNFWELRNLLAEEDFSMYWKCRQKHCALHFLYALFVTSPGRFAALPWTRILAERALSAFGWKNTVLSISCAPSWADLWFCPGFAF